VNARDKTPRTALIGQVFPYRGGIAQYNTQLHRALTLNKAHITLSFKKLYPKFLYPGASDIEVGAQGKKEDNVDYLIHVYKPWSLYNTAARIEEEDIDVAFLTWWTLIWQPGIAFLAWLLRRRGIKVVYICHNVFDHDGSAFKKNISKHLLKYADGYVVHSTGDEKALKRYYPNKPMLNTKVLPVYDHYPMSKKQAVKRGRLEILSFGFIRPYKGLDDLVTALAQLNDSTLFLTVVGESWIDPKELKAKLRNMGAPNVETQLKYVDDEEAAFYFSRADIVAIPYRQDTASAVASLAFNYKKPLLGSNVEGIKDIIESNKTGWLVEPSSPESIAGILKKITRSDVEKMRPNIEKFCKEHSWDSMAEKLSAFAKAILQNS